VPGAVRQAPSHAGKQAESFGDMRKHHHDQTGCAEYL